MMMKTDIRPQWGILKDQFPGLYDQIKDFSVNGQEIRVKQARKTDEEILEKYIGDSWQSLYSKFNPLDETEKWANSVDGNPKHIVLFGFGLGYHFEALVSRFPLVHFHIIEPDPQLFLRYITEKGVSSAFSTHVEDFLISDRAEDYKDFCLSVFHRMDESWVFLSLPKFVSAYPEAYQIYSETLIHVKNDYSESLRSFYAFEKIWNFNALKNLPQIHQSPDIFDCKDQFKGKTVILTASGPSLNEAIPFIKRMQASGKAIIIAAGTSVNGLLSKGVRPDLFVSYDPRINNYHALKNVLDANIPFVFGSTIYPDIPKEYKGPKAHMKTSPDKIAVHLNPHLPQNRIVQDAPTITAVALDLLDKLGVKTVYMAGQDLCFINKKTGADGVYYHNKKGEVRNKDLKNKRSVENNNGEIAETNRSFFNMKTFIEDLIEKMDDGMSMYSMSLYGAKIKGMPYRSLEQVEADLAENEPVKLNFDWVETDSTDEIEKIMSHLKKKIACFAEIKEALERQFHRFQTAPDKQKTKWRDKVDQSLDRLTLHPDYQEIIYPLITNRINYMIRLNSNADFNDPKQVEDYFDRGVRPLIAELTNILDQYSKILANESMDKVKR